MSRARRFAAGVATTPFPWGGTLPPGDAVTTAALAGVQIVTDGSGAGPVSPSRLSEIEREAFAKGYEQGDRSGMEAGKSRADAMLRRMASTLEELASLRQQMIQHTERQMVQLALTIAKKILRREVTLDPDLTVAMARVALDRLGEQSGATIRLHPDDYALVVGETKERWESDQVTVVASESLSRGGCRIESAFGFIEAGVDAQFEEIEQAVLGGEPVHAVATPDESVASDAAEPEE